ncbi:MAG: molybdenum cofactor guanylyltransferase [Chloroflexi bacterium]|nr:MAG: molybdenum cofactor guanylyltransferase [Chloroflexota bacterium]
MFTIVIQAGGQSIRMGQNKALMPFLGQPIIARLAGRLRNVADELLVTTNQPENFRFLGLPLFLDLKPGLGALGGLYTALSAARAPFTAVVACDMPFIEPKLLAAQRDLLRTESVDVVIPRSTLGLEPLHAVYRRETCLPVVGAALESGERRMVGWLSAVRVRVMEPDEMAVYDPDHRSFVNVNTPEEFHHAEALARRLG